MKIKLTERVVFLSTFDWRIAVGLIFIGSTVFQLFLVSPPLFERISRAVLIDHSRPEVHLHLAHYAAQLGDYDLSKSELDRASRFLKRVDEEDMVQVTNSFSHTQHIVRSYDRTHDLIEYWEKILVEQPQNIDAHLRLALYYYTLLQTNRALGHLNLATQLNPNHPALQAISSLFERDGSL